VKESLASMDAKAKLDACKEIDDKRADGDDGESVLLDMTKRVNAIPDLSKPLPHTRASIHPRELPAEFQDAAFVQKVVSIYACDFKAFGYEP